MTITLQDLRNATLEYCKTKVTIDISTPIKPDTDPEYTCTVTVTNATEANGGVNILNPVLHLWFTEADAAYAKLNPVPLAYATLSDAETGKNPLPPTAFPLREVYARLGVPSIPPGRSQTLKISMAELKTGGAPILRAMVYADPDMNYLFPKADPSAECDKQFNTV